MGSWRPSNTIKDIISFNIFSRKKYHIVAGKRLTNGLQKLQSRLFDFITSLCIGFNASDINAQPKIFPSKYKDYFLLDESPDDFALDMYYFKIFNDLKEHI